MLLYLSGHTRPDIAFIVSQCACYTRSPRRSHEKALERIGPYLKATADKGMVLNPMSNDTMKTDFYDDADFASLWGVEDKQDPSCVKNKLDTLFSLTIVRYVGQANSSQISLQVQWKANTMHYPWRCARSFHSFASPRRFVLESEWLILPKPSFSKPWFMKITMVEPSGLQHWNLVE
jgi:hypothetical protein